jgi:hypothetical protein
MNLKWIEKILIISIFAGFSCHAAQIPLNKILGSNLDYFFIHPNNALFNEYKDLILLNNPITNPNKIHNVSSICAGSDGLFYNANLNILNFNVIKDTTMNLNIPMTLPTQVMACSPNGTLIGTAQGSNIIISTPNRRYSGLMPESITSLSLSNSNHLATGSRAGKISYYEIKTNQTNPNLLEPVPQKEFTFSNYSIQQILFTSDSQNLIAICNTTSRGKNKVIIYNPNMLNTIPKEIHTDQSQIKKVCISNADQYIAILNNEGIVHIYKNTGKTSYTKFVQIDSYLPGLILTIDFFDKLPYLLIGTPGTIKLVNFYPYQSWFNYGTSFIFAPHIKVNDNNSIDPKLPSFYQMLAEQTKINIMARPFKLLRGFYFNKERDALINNEVLNKKLLVSTRNSIFLKIDFAKDTSISARAPGWFTVRNAAIVSAIGAGAYTYYYLRSHPELLQKLTLGIGSTTAQAAKAAVPVIKHAQDKMGGIVPPERAAEIARAVVEGNLLPTQ